MCLIHNSLRSSLFLSLSTTGLIAPSPPFFWQGGYWSELKPILCHTCPTDDSRSRNTCARICKQSHTMLNNHQTTSHLCLVLSTWMGINLKTMCQLKSTFGSFSSGHAEMPKTITKGLCLLIDARLHTVIFLLLYLHLGPSSSHYYNLTYGLLPLQKLNKKQCKKYPVLQFLFLCLLLSKLLSPNSQLWQ